MTLLSKNIDTLKYIDEEGEIVSYQEYFRFKYHSSYWNDDYVIYRTEVYATNDLQKIVALWNRFGSIIYYRTPVDIGVSYRGTSTGPYDQMVLLDTSGLTINGEYKMSRRVKYLSWPPLGLPDFEIVFLEGIGVYEMKEPESGRVWSLKSHYLYNL